MNKKTIYLTIGLSLAAVAGVIWYRNRKDKNSNSSDVKTKISITTDNAPINAGTISSSPGVVVKGKTNTAKPSLSGPGKEISFDKAINPAVGLISVLGEKIAARYNGNGIYDTKLTKVGVTKQGEFLGVIVEAKLAGNNTYNLTYKDGKGNVRVVNSTAVNVIK